MGLLSVVLRFPEAPAGARREQQAGKAGSRQHPAVLDAPQTQLARTERCPWAAALLCHGFEAAVRAHGTGLDPGSVPGPREAQLMEKEPPLPPGCGVVLG